VVTLWYNTSMADNFVSYDRDTLFLMPPSVQDWVPEGSLARFVVDMVGQLDLRAIRDSYDGRGSAAYHPEMLVALLFYGYATGVRASRKLEAATYDSVAFRFIAANTHPDHDTIAAFRLRFLPLLKGLFNQVLVMAKEVGCVDVGKVSLDGTKIKASASKHRALSLKGIDRQTARLNRIVERMFELAEEADRADEPDGMDLPAELQRREDRLKALAAAKERIKAREAEQQTQDKLDYEEILADRQRIEELNGRKLTSRPPKRPSKGDRSDPQLSLTDAESRIMPSSEGFIQGYNAQLAVDTKSMLILAEDLSQRPTDRRLLKPMLAQLNDLPIGKPQAIIADAGYYSEVNVELCVEAGFIPYIVPKKDQHHWGLRHWQVPKEPSPRASALKQMLYRLRTVAGRATYALRKQTVEPVIGNIKRAMGFRQFLLRGKRKAKGEWTLGCIAWNIRHLHAMATT
jgi:transposase